MITKYIKGALVALLLFLGLGFKHFKDKSKRLDKELDQQKQRNTKQLDQIKTHLEQQQVTRDAIKQAEADSHNTNRDYFNKLRK
tara:strand:- start:21466 stop:21717 length:252 start_codon:yes stop_codon:yes gene_type:complete